MAKQQQQMTQQQIQQLKEHQNSEFMRLSRPQEIKMNAENGKHFQQGRTVNFSAPILAGAYATDVLLKIKVKANWDAGTTGTIKANAGFPHNLINKYEITFGNKMQTGLTYLHKIRDLMEGYGRTESDDVVGYRAAGIEEMLRKVPQTITEGENEIVFQVKIPLNLLHPSSINGQIPVFGSGTRLQLGLQLPNAVAGKDPMDNVFDVTGDGSVEVTGEVDAILVYRDHNSMSTTQAVEPSLDGTSTVQLIELPSVVGIVPNTFNYASLRNPYNFASIFSVVIDGKQSDKFASAGNITGYALDRQENTNSSFFRYGDDIGMDDYYRRFRSLYGNDLPEGVFGWSASDENTSNVSSKTGSAYLNLSGSGYPSARLGFRVASVGQQDIASRVLTYGILINPQGISAV